MSTNGEEKVKFERLPVTVTPLNYDLTFTPKWADFTFTCSEVIDVQVLESTGTVILNCGGNLTIKSVVFETSNPSKKLNCTGQAVDSSRELLTLLFESSLPRGTGKIFIEYAGPVADNLVGFFRSKYNVNGQVRYNFLTKFEPTYARLCFPCWDEPAIKATFDISLVVPKELRAVSNMPVKEEKALSSDPSKRQIIFEKSVKMSTYLMAFAIGEFDYIEDHSKEGVLCRVYTPVGKTDQGRFALKVATKAISYYNDYFRIPYPLPKMDLLCVKEFPCGAMENWGLIIYRDTSLLYDKKHSSTAAKQWVAIVVAHEIAHQWFGNLVTMEWWTDLWLNEGYASFMEYLCVSALYPEFDVWPQFASTVVNSAQDLDALKHSHPIEVVVQNPSQIAEIFDSISYDKGASIIRMCYYWMGDAKFRAGMQLYLNKYKFSNAETKDLWEALEESSGLPITSVMPTWTLQMGFPLVTVKNVSKMTEEGSVCTYTYSLKQSKFWADATQASSNPPNKWFIPITYCTESDPSKVVSCDVPIGDSDEFTVIVSAVPDEWIKLNASLVGFYRVQYQDGYVDRFIPAIQNLTLTESDRIGLLADLYAVVKSGNGKTDEVLQFLQSYKNEPSYSVWLMIFEIMTELSRFAVECDSNSSTKSNFNIYGQRLFQNVMDKVGWVPKPNEDAQTSLLRTLVLVRMVGFQHPETLSKAKHLFDGMAEGEQVIPADLRPAIYRAVLLLPEEDINVNQKSTYFEALLNMYAKTDMQEEKLRILRAFGVAKSKYLIDEILKFGLSSQVSPQDAVVLLINVAIGSPLGAQQSWEVFKTHRQMFQDRLPKGGRIIRTMIKSVAETFFAESKASEIDKYFKENPMEGMERTVSQVLETIRIQASWIQKDKSSFQAFLAGVN